MGVGSGVSAGLSEEGEFALESVSRFSGEMLGQTAGDPGREAPEAGG